nr:unnamed protein product [Spirometra erinaceieuropaei]
MDGNFPSFSADKTTMSGELPPSENGRKWRNPKTPHDPITWVMGDMPEWASPSKRRTGRSSAHGQQRCKRRGMRWLLESQAVLLHQIAQLRNQKVTVMDLFQGLRGSSTCTSAVSGPLLTQMETLDELDVLVSVLGDNSYRQQLMMYLSTLGGDTVVSFVDRIFGALFSERITCYVTFYGRRQGMKPSFGTHLYNLALGCQFH